MALICSGFFAVGNTGLVKQPEENLFGSDKEFHNSSGLLITAYAAEKEGDSLNENFSADSVPTILKTDIEVMLSNYNPLMSSVPGLPLTISADKGENKESEITLSVSCTTGTFCRWDCNTGKVTEEGNNVNCVSEKTIYCRPALNENSEYNNSNVSHKWNVKKNIKSVSQIEVTAFNEQNKKSGKQLLIIGKDNMNYFAVLENVE